MLYNVYCICRLCSAWVNPCRCAASGVCRINLPPPQQTAPRSRNKSIKGKLKTRIAQVLLGSNINMRNYVAPHYGSDFQLLHYINAMDFFFFPSLQSRQFKHRSCLEVTRNMWNQNRGALQPYMCIIMYVHSLNKFRNN